MQRSATSHADTVGLLDTRTRTHTRTHTHGTFFALSQVMSELASAVHFPIARHYKEPHTRTYIHACIHTYVRTRARTPPRQVMSELASATKAALVSFLKEHFPVARHYKEPYIRSTEEIVSMAAVYATNGIAYDLEGACVCVGRMVCVPGVRSCSCTIVRLSSAEEIVSMAAVYATNGIAYDLEGACLCVCQTCGVCVLLMLNIRSAEGIVIMAAVYATNGIAYDLEGGCVCQTCGVCAWCLTFMAVRMVW